MAGHSSINIVGEKKKKGRAGKQSELAVPDPVTYFLNTTWHESHPWLRLRRHLLLNFLEGNSGSGWEESDELWSSFTSFWPQKSFKVRQE